MTCPTISIIMNCYNNASTLHEALQSVFAQSFEHWEIIFFDNGSSDESMNIAQDFAKKSDKIQIFQDSVRISLGHSRNQALAHARGEYIAFLDCDDIWLSTKLEKQMQIMLKNPKIALSCTNAENFYVYNNRHKSLGLVFDVARPHRGNVFCKLILGQWITMSSVLLRHDYLKKQNADGQYFDITLNICEEAELFYRLAHAWEFDYVDEVLTKRRIHHNNITFTRFDELASETEYILKKQYKLYPDFAKNYPDIAKALKERASFQHSIGLWRSGQAKIARSALGECTSLKSRLFYVVSFFPPSLFPHFTKLYLKFSKYL